MKVVYKFYLANLLALFYSSSASADSLEKPKKQKVHG